MFILIRRRPTWGILVAVSASVVLAAAANPPTNLQALHAGLSRSRELAISHFSALEAATGFASEIVARLDADLTAISQTDTSDAAALDRQSLQVHLDESLVSQLVSGTDKDVGAAGGATLRLVKASSDGKLQPLAIYVPASSSTQKWSPLIIMLHGQGQTETELLADPHLRALADGTGAIFAVPWARGDRGFDAVTAADIYDALNFLDATYPIDRHRTYLAGVSDGGFGTFIVAPVHSDRWTGLLSIAGTLTNDDKDKFVRTMWSKQVFLVVGSDDPVVKPQYVRGAAAYLNANGIECHYYEQQGGLHSLASLQPSIDRAWRDMLSGVRNVAPDNGIPSPSVTASQRY